MKVLVKGRNAILSTKISKYLFSKTFQGVRNRENINSQTRLCKTCEKIVKIGIVPLFHKQCKTPFRDDMVRLKIISLYIYKDLRLKTYDLRSSESRVHYHEDGNLVPSARCGFSFEAAFQLRGLKLTISYT